jgi:hypothetical protein
LEDLISGPNPQRKSYTSFASFNDPDGNGWVLQEITARLTGNLEMGDTPFTTELPNWVRREATRQHRRESNVDLGRWRVLTRRHHRPLA